MLYEVITVAQGSVVVEDDREEGEPLLPQHLAHGEGAARDLHADDERAPVLRQGRDSVVGQRRLDRAVEDEMLREIFDLAKMGPTSANCSPMRVSYNFV